MAKKTRIDVEFNQSLIHDTYISLVQQLKRKPRLKEVSDQCGLSYHTVSKHCASLTFEPAKDPLRVLTDSVVLSIYSSARSGNSASQKLWLQLMEGWIEKKDESGDTAQTRVIRKKAND